MRKSGMVVFPVAKINLGLHITRKRPDGYHEIETIFYPVGLCDALEILPGTEGSFADNITVTGLNPEVSPESNLVIRAVERVRRIHSIPFLRIHLHKVIPVGAGLGGGSSDAAYAIKAVDRLFSLSFEPDRMRTIAAGLGSDCPFFVEASPAYATGRGEILKPLPKILEGYYLLLVNPGVRISTAEAYENCLPSVHESDLAAIASGRLSQWQDLMINDFEKTVFRKYPEIGALKNFLYETGAVFSLMSGSGSTVYGIFRNRPDIPGRLKDHILYEGTL
ncbi:MAG: 4-(cytidine 5'-diphospho)-2-C-methyl-D-erythritol kinase [Bacteroidales bacterium]